MNNLSLGRYVKGGEVATTNSPIRRVITAI
jgi:hypothetical protein